MINLPNKPFTTKDFSLEGGGIDFLGLRWVNLTIVGEYLLPQLNNVTTDMGTFFLGGWIPWKFKQLCASGKENDYTPDNYRAFREKVEVAISQTLHGDMSFNRACGLVRNRVGITQKCKLPGKLDFVSAQRKSQNSLYAAAIYGPALIALGLVKTYHSLDRTGTKRLKIAVPGDDSETEAILQGVDRSLKRTNAYSLLASLDTAPFTAKDIWKLAEVGLDPARYRAAEYRDLKARFRRKLLPDDAKDPGYARTQTARLLFKTLQQAQPLTTDQIRNIWYTGMLPVGDLLYLEQQELADHATRWACFMARQYQRYAIELFLWCFEDAIANGNRSVAEIVDYWLKRATAGGEKLPETFADVARELAGALYKPDEVATSRAWNKKVSADDDRFEFIPDPQGDLSALHGLRMFAGWYWRMLSRQEDARNKTFMNLGGADRMSMGWFLKWLSDRMNMPIASLLKDIFSDLVFSQHMRIAMTRFDGTTQRLRFLIGDGGIEPSVTAKQDMGNLYLPWMPDRLDTLVALLCDCDLLIGKEGEYRLGPSAKEFKN
jgi:hypothetical protein